MDAKEEIRSRIDIVDYISTYVRLAKRGKNWLGLCPFHSEKTPSFNVNREHQMYKCFGCGEGGDLFRFVMKTDGLTFREALERLADKAGVTLEDRPSGPSVDKRERARAMHHEAARFYAQTLWNTPEALEYASGRGLTDETLRGFGIGWAPDAWNALTDHLGQVGWTGRDLYEASLARASERGTFYDAFRGRLMFPIFDVQNRVIAFGGRLVGEGEPKYLNTPESPIFNKSNTLYALNFANKPIADEDRVLVMEGYMDVVAAHQAGFRFAVATLGTSLTEEHVRLLSRKTRRVILAYDADSAGIRAALRAGPMFEEAEMDVRLLVLPEGHDPDTYIKAFGAPAFAERLDAAVPLLDFELAQLRFQYDMDSAAGRTEYVRAALPVLAKVRSNVTRDRYIRELAELWAQGDMARVAYREEDIRRDLAVRRRKMIAEQRAKWRSQHGHAPASSLQELANRPGEAAPAGAAAAGPAPEGAPSEGGAASAPAEAREPAPDLSSGLAVKERLVLRALLQEPGLVRPHALAPEEFSEGPHREVARLALSRRDDGAADPLDDLAALPESLTRLVTELSLISEPEMTAAVVSQAVSFMRLYLRRQRLQVLHEYVQQQSRLDPSDPLVQEWHALQQAERYSDGARVS